MSNKLPKAVPQQHMPDMQSAAMQHQLHLQTIDVLTKLYATAVHNPTSTLTLSLEKALVNLMEPFQPSLPPSPVIQ